MKKGVQTFLSSQLSEKLVKGPAKLKVQCWKDERSCGEAVTDAEGVAMFENLEPGKVKF